MPSKPFLTARWANLIIVSYHAPESFLAPHLPAGLELDLIEGQPTLSLVAFQFLDTRVWGVRWPGFVNFPELNLRFYVREKSTQARGVVFIREFVPSIITSFFAKQIYNEPYEAAGFTHEICREAGSISTAYTLHLDGRTHTLRATGSDDLTTPEDNTAAHLLKEQQWGYGRTRAGQTLKYEVTHPRWRVFSHAACDVDVDWSSLYGPKWAAMQSAEPFSVVLAEGSEVAVYGARAL